MSKEVTNQEADAQPELGKSINDSEQQLILNEESQDTFKKNDQTQQNIRSNWLPPDQLEKMNKQKRGKIVSESQDGLEGADVNSLHGQKHFSRYRQNVRSEKKLEVNERAKGQALLAPAAPGRSNVNDKQELDKSQRSRGKSSVAADLFHLDPDNQAKIERALNGEQALKKDHHVDFFEKFTPQDFQHNLHKDEGIMAIQHKYQQKNEEVYRQQQQIIGFISPENMLESDWLFSIATNKQDEEQILRNVQAYEHDAKVELEDVDGDSIHSSHVDYTPEPPAQEFDLTKLIIIKHDGYFSMIWTIFDISCCLASSYFYLWLATFGENQKPGKCYATMTEAEQVLFNKEGATTYQIVLAFEIIFLISIITKFLTDYRPDGETEHVKSLSKISSRYLHGDFLSDFIPLIPLTYIFKNYYCQAKLFYVIKTVRVLNGFKLFNVGNMFGKIKELSQSRMERLIRNNQSLAEDMDEDHNQIENLMIINYMLKTFRLIIIIVNIAFFIGMFWLIYCEVTMNLVQDWNKTAIKEYIQTNRWDLPADASGTEIYDVTKCALYMNDTSPEYVKWRSEAVNATQKEQKEQKCTALATNLTAQEKAVTTADAAVTAHNNSTTTPKVGTAAAANTTTTNTTLTALEKKALKLKLTLTAAKAAVTKTKNKQTAGACASAGKAAASGKQQYSAHTQLEEFTKTVSACKGVTKFTKELYVPEFFLTHFGVSEKSNTDQAIIAMYYSFTSLTTVGFGDYNPRSEFERIFCAMILLFGVAIFSYIMGNFKEVLEKFNQLNEDLDDGDELTKFFGLLQRFNGNKSINLELRNKIEAFFDYKWNNDRKMAIDDEEELALLEQLPTEVQDKLLVGYLYNNFLHTFTDFFRLSIENNSLFSVGTAEKRTLYYTWVDQNYRNFMTQLLLNLEPRKDPKHSILVDELDEFNEISFIDKGEVVIGYEINKQRRYCIQFKNKCVIGAYGITFNKRAAFIYTALTAVEGFFIRKQNWLDLLEVSPDITFVLKRNVLMDYLCKIRLKVQVNKKKAIEKIQNRQDHQMIQVSAMKDIYSQQALIEENFGQDQEDQDEKEKAFYEQQMQDFAEKMDTYEAGVVNVLNEIQEKENSLYQINEQLEDVDAQIAKEEEIFREFQMRLGQNTEGEN